MASAERTSSRKLAPQPKQHVKVERDATCAVCRRPGCRLQSHQTYLAHRLRTTKEVVNRPKGEHTTTNAKVLDRAYSASYAFTRDNPPTTNSPHGINSGRLDGFNDLPVPGGHRTELHHAVYSSEPSISPFTFLFLPSSRVNKTLTRG